MSDRPKPTIYPETRFYWDGAKNGKLLLNSCTSCSKAYFPPRPFCPNCGSRLYGTSELVPGTYGVMAGCLDNTSAYRPKVTTYAKRLQAWDQMAEGVPSFPAMPPM
jgi:uncharacterized protein